MLELQVLEKYVAGGDRYEDVHPFTPSAPRAEHNDDRTNHDDGSAGSLRQHHVVESPAVKGATIREEIKLVGPTITVTKGGIVATSYTPDTWGEDVIAVVRTRFYIHHLGSTKEVTYPTLDHEALSGTQPAIAAIYPTRIRIFFDDGSAFIMHLKKPVSAAWALRTGLLLQHEAKVTSDGPWSRFFYTVRHPFEEMTPVEFPTDIDKGRTLAPDQSDDIENELNHDIIFVAHDSRKEKLLVSFNRESQRHFIWKYAFEARQSVGARLAGKRKSEPSSLDIVSMLNFDMRHEKTRMVLKKRWEEVDQIEFTAAAEKVFMAHTSEPAEVMCFLGGRRNKAFGSARAVVIRLEAGSAMGEGSAESVASFENVQSAVAVAATRPELLDVLLLLNDQTLSLWAGEEQSIYPVTTPALTEEPGTDIVGLNGQAGNVVNLRMSDDTVVRAQLAFAPKSELTRRCLHALKVLLSNDEAAAVCREYLALQSTGAGAADEWDNFIVGLFSFCQPSAGGIASGGDLEWLLQEGLGTTRIGSTLRSVCAPVVSFKIEPKFTKLWAAAGSQNVERPKELDLRDRLPTIVEGLHVIYEDLRLDRTKMSDVHKLGCLLLELAHMSSLPEFCQYYLSHGIPPPVLHRIPETSSSIHNMNPPLNVYALLQRFMIKSDLVVFRMEPAHKLIDRLRLCCTRIHRLFLVFDKYSTKPKNVVREMGIPGFSSYEIDSLPNGIALPLLCAIDQCRLKPPAKWSKEAYELIGRIDLASQLSHTGRPAVKSSLVDIMKANKTHDTLGLWDTTKAKDVDKPEYDETGTEVELDDILKLRFPLDRRLKEAQRLLQSARDTVIEIMEQVDDDQEYREETQQRKLTLLSARTLALPVGRGILTFATAVPSQTNLFPVPKLEVMATFRYMQEDEQTEVHSVELDTAKAKLSADLYEWPGFHDGVAWGLKVPPDCPDIDSTWIAFQRTNPDDNLTTRHAGFVFAMGLIGHLRNLKRDSHMEYLRMEDPYVTMGYLLGYGAARMGMADLEVSRLVYVHLGPLEGDPPLVRSACAVALGLLHVGLNSKYHADRILGEMKGIRITEVDTSNRLLETYGMSCGLAIGLLMLGKGENNSVIGSSKAGFASTLLKFGVGANADLTEAGATLGIGLAYLKSNNQRVAETLVIPKNRHQLDQVRPHILLLRILARNLVSWNGIESSTTWIDSQIPDYLWEVAQSESWGPDGVAGDADFDPGSAAHAKWSIVAGACFSIGLKYAGSGDVAVRDLLLTQLDRFIGKSGGSGFHASYQSKMDRGIARSCTDVLAISLGLVMVGTGDIAVMRRLRKLHGRLGQDVTYGSHMAVHMALGFLFLGGGRYTLSQSDRAIAALVCALVPPFPGAATDSRGHLQALRHLWVLAVEPRVLVTQDARTGEAISIPIFVKLLGGEAGATPTEVEIVTPGMLPSFHTIDSIRTYKDEETPTDSDKCWPIKLDIHSDPAVQQRLRQTGVMVVQARENAILNEAILDEIAASSLVSGLAKHASATEAVDANSLISWKRYANRNNNDIDSETGSAKPKPWETIIKECIAHDKRSVLQTHLWLHRLVENFADLVTVDVVWNLKMISTLYGLEAHVQPPKMLDSGLVGTVMKMVEVHFKGWEGEVKSLPGGGSLDQALRLYMRGEEIHPVCSERDHEIVAAYLVWNEWPDGGVLKGLLEEHRAGNSHRPLTVFLMLKLKGLGTKTPIATLRKIESLCK
ncbi:Anaphase-promoting complex subunit 1 [Rhizophlyctis rosea]|uniref:Anaphase-promoting complex subunit 1 n=1 Tax=Rhizophlyctis rosea TaxID=64517 RepID=A0AAD5X3L5_9FUNG|nr:Anaphase-promoting complex subunit 1 [Rhizophlyctis rosea]